MFEEYKPEFKHNNGFNENLEKALTLYQDKKDIVSRVRENIEKIKDELNTIAGEEAFLVSKTHKDNDVSIYYKIVVKKSVFEDIKKVA